MRILFFGNADNANLRLCMWSRALGRDAYLWRMDEEGRGDPLEYDKEYFSKGFPSWMIGGEKSTKDLFLSSLYVDKDIEYINKNFDIVVVSGRRSLYLSKNITLPKVLFPVGYETSGLKSTIDIQKTLKYLFKFNFKQLFDIYFDYICWRSFKSLNAIFDSWPAHEEYYQKFNSMHKLFKIGFAEDCERFRSFVDPVFFKNLSKKTKGSKRIFLWLSRLNFKNEQDINYKGVNIFMEALGEFTQEMKAGDLSVFMLDFGLDRDEFHYIWKEFPFYKHIHFVNHLSMKELATILSLKYATVFTEFGPKNKGITGIGRDALTMGTVVVNNWEDHFMCLQNICAAPRLYAADRSQIIDKMNYLLNISDSSFDELQKKTLEYSNEYIDYKPYMKVFNKLLEKVKKN